MVNPLPAGDAKFDDVLRQLRRGGALFDLSEALGNLAQQVQDTGKVGELVLKLKLKPDAGRQVMVEDSITVKAPAMQTEKTLFFVTDAGDLVREDPDQKQIPFGAPVEVTPAAPDEVHDPSRRVAAVDVTDATTAKNKKAESA